MQLGSNLFKLVGVFANVAVVIFQLLHKLINIAHRPLAFTQCLLTQRPSIALIPAQHIPAKAGSVLHLLGKLHPFSSCILASIHLAQEVIGQLVDATSD